MTNTCTGTVITESRPSSLAVLFIIALIIGWLLVILLLWGLVLSEIDTLRRKNSVKKVKNHKSMLNCVTVLLAIPALTFIFPLLFCYLALIKSSGGTEIGSGNFIFTIMSLRTLCNSLAIIAMNGVYRKFIIDKTRSFIGKIGKLRKQNSINNDEVTMY